MTLYTHSSLRCKYVLSTAVALMLSLALPAYAASNSMDTPSGNTMGSPAPSGQGTIPNAPVVDSNMKQYPDMTEQDCKALTSNRKKYKKSEYMSRKEYCKKTFSGPATTGPGPATDQYQDNRLMDNNPSSGGNVDTGNTMERDSTNPRDNSPQGGITPRNNMDTPPANAKE